MKCRHCHLPLEHIFLDLGFTALSNAYLSEDELLVPESTYPLKLAICDNCWLLQTMDYIESFQLFSCDYAYFSSISQGWLNHASQYVEKITQRLQLTNQSFVMEIGSNDGYLLKNFMSAGIPCLGVEPSDSTADAAEKIGVPVLRAFWGAAVARRLIKKGISADLICANNVYAHVPDINDFTQGLQIALKPGGAITIEFPYLLNLIDQYQFDTVYHEHFSYLSLTIVIRIFEQAGLRLFDVEELPTHGGSLRIYGCHVNDPRSTEFAVSNLLKKERSFGLLDLVIYKSFQQKADKVKNDFLMFLIEQKNAGSSVAGYGAAAKGNTLLNYAGLKHDLIDFICDAAPSKQGKYMPGSHIPIVAPSELSKRKPDWVIIFPWNIAAEIIQQQEQVLAWGGKFVVAVPRLIILA